MTVRDFTQIFDSYSKFEEDLSTKKMEEVAAADMPSAADELELNRRIARYEKLIKRRPLLVNDVLLRQVFFFFWYIKFHLCSLLEPKQRQRVARAGEPFCWKTRTGTTARCLLHS